MAWLPEYLSLSKRIIDRLLVDDKDTVFWDRDLPGFGIRVYPSGAKVYVVQTRGFGRSNEGVVEDIMEHYRRNPGLIQSKEAKFQKVAKRYSGL